MLFRNREDAARQLADKLTGRPFRDLLVLGIPRGGVVIGAVLAQDLNADLDVVLARKLRAPGQPELAVGALSEDGEVYLNRYAEDVLRLSKEYLDQERDYQLAEIARRQKLFRAARPQAPIQGRSILLTDDGIATGSTMNAALHVVAGQKPHEVVVAVPVASPDRLRPLRRQCDDLICLYSPRDFYAIGQFYADFSQIEDEEVLALLRPFAPKGSGK